MSQSSLPTTERRRRRGHARSAYTTRPRTHTIRVFLLLVLLLGLPLIYSGSRILLADIAAYQAKAFVNDWQSKGLEPQPHAWKIAYTAAQRAIDLYPGSNGEYLARLGNIHQWRHAHAPFGDKAAEASRRAALEAFRKATQARPTWPYDWASLAFTKLYLLEFDEEFAHALQQARQLGPTRIDINNTLAEIGLIAWPSLNDAQRKTWHESARFTINYSPRTAQQLLAVAERSHMTDMLCATVDAATQKRQRICQ